MQQYGPVAVQGRYGSAEVLLPPGQHSNYNSALGSRNLYSIQVEKSYYLEKGIADDISAMAQSMGVSEMERGRMGVKVSSEHLPLDPNLTCPVCLAMFKKREIQKFKCHVEACHHERM